MDRIERVNKRIDDLEKRIAVDGEIRIITGNRDYPKLSRAILFASGMALFISSFAFGWHWGWSIAIGVCTVSSLGAMD